MVYLKLNFYFPRWVGVGGWVVVINGLKVNSVLLDLPTGTELGNYVRLTIHGCLSPV